MASSSAGGQLNLALFPHRKCETFAESEPGPWKEEYGVPYILPCPQGTHLLMLAHLGPQLEVEVDSSGIRRKVLQFSGHPFADGCRAHVTMWALAWLCRSRAHLRPWCPFVPTRTAA